jgi:hypothetical protein
MIEMFLYLHRRMDYSGTPAMRLLKIVNDSFFVPDLKNSKTNDFIQVEDIIMGAIGYEMNNVHIKTNAKRAKVELADYIATASLPHNIHNPPALRQRQLRVGGVILGDALHGAPVGQGMCCFPISCL